MEQNEKKDKGIINKFLWIFHFFLFFFFSSHRCCNEVNNPIWVGIVPFRLFWESQLKWKEKQNEKKDKKNKTNFYECFISFLFFFFCSYSHCNGCENQKKKMKWTVLKLLLILLFFFLCSFHVSYLYQNNLNGTIPTQIVLLN